MGEHDSEPYDVSSAADLTPALLEKFRLAFHDIVTPQLVADPTYVGAGHVYALDADLLETVNDAFRSAVGEKDDPSDDPQPLDVFSLIADGTDSSLITFEITGMVGSSWGMDSAKILDRGYLYLTGDPGDDIPWNLVAAWEPAASREAFEHAFLSNYVEYAKGDQDDHTPPFEPGGWGSSIVGVGVPTSVLTEAMYRFLDVKPEAWRNVWEIINPASMPTAEMVATLLAIPQAAAAVAITAIRDDDHVFKEAIAEAPEDRRRVSLCVYLHAMGVLPDGPDQEADP